MGRKEEQKTALETAVRLDPNLVEARYALANLAREQGATVQSQQQFAKVQQLRSTEANHDVALGHVRAGVLLAEKHEYDSAIEHFRKAVAIDPRLGEAHFDLAGALLEKGQLTAAITSFRQAIKLAPEWAEAHYQLGRALLLTGNREAARLEFRTALKYDPQHAPAQKALRPGNAAH
jgi:tetratricopeptide (TPR) repeat protein